MISGQASEADPQEQQRFRLQRPFYPRLTGGQTEGQWNNGANKRPHVPIAGPARWTFKTLFRPDQLAERGRRYLMMYLELTECTELRINGLRRKWGRASYFEQKRPRR